MLSTDFSKNNQIKTKQNFKRNKKKGSDKIPPTKKKQTNYKTIPLQIMQIRSSTERRRKDFVLCSKILRGLITL